MVTSYCRITAPRLLQLLAGRLLWLAVSTTAKAADLSTAALKGTRCSNSDVDNKVLQEANGPSMLQRTKKAVSEEEDHEASTTISKEDALNATQRYIQALNSAGQGHRTPYLFHTFLDDCAESAEVIDPVGRAPHKSYKGFNEVLDQWPNLTLQTHVSVVAQDYSYTAAFSTMTFNDPSGETIVTNRTDFLKIESDGSVRSVHAYWSNGNEHSSQYDTTVRTIKQYFKALNELGTGQSTEYFNQFAASFEVRDPLGTTPSTSLEQLQLAIPELAKNVAPKGFTVSVEGLAIATDPQMGSAYLKLNIVEGPIIDIVDLFRITSGDDGSPARISNLTAVWHVF